ncbi:ZIP family metal transporter [Candidatus Saccharibacteria bacterium]|nr:ZIP family metal transporter [Candidatus Saccharibacteria bacterium]
MESNLVLVILFSFIGGIFSLIGGILLLIKKSWSRIFARYATPFAAGALLAAAFIDLLPEAIEGGSDSRRVMIYTLIGLLFFFLLESVVRWFHNHTDKGKKINPILPLIVIGDSVHNFIDGLAIAAGFLISPGSGIIVTLAVAAHEIPQEIGDFGLMLDIGVDRVRVLLINLMSSAATVIAAVIFFVLGNAYDVSLTPMLGIVAGFFIYIAATDIIPTLHEEKIKKEVLKKAACLLFGVILVGFAIITFHGFIDENSSCRRAEENSVSCYDRDD